jgi:hypothetical protein
VIASRIAGLAQSGRALLATGRGRFIAAFLAVQLLVPLTYYTVRRDPHDERFAWRMFSPMRMVQCDPRFVVDDQPFALGSRFHEAWIELAKRGRYVVIEAMAAELCREPGARAGRSVRVSLTCRGLDGADEFRGGHDLCRIPEL